VLRNAFSIALAVWITLACGSCGKRTKVRAPVRPALIGDVEKGNASWYGDPYHGRRAASGEVFDMEQLTAAHRTLPFQTWVEVTNLTNGRQVMVRINDRGPFVDGRIIDLSRAAARAVDMLRSGIAPVELRVVPPPASLPASSPPPAPRNPGEAPSETPAEGAVEAREPSNGEYAVQAGAFSDPGRAEALRDALPFADSRVVSDPDRPLWRVWVGRALNMDAAQALAAQVKEMTGESLVVRDR
jgi:rare lipoprotein A